MADTDTYPTTNNSNVTFQNLSSLLNVSKSDQAAAQAPAQQTGQTQQPQTDASNSPVLGVRGTHYGYKGDPNTDPNSAVGRGAWDNQLQDAVSVALSPDVEAKLGVQPNEELLWTGADGTQRKVTFHDRTSSSLRGRVDFYDKSGQIGDLGEGTIQRIGAKGQTIPMLETSDTSTQQQPAAFGMRVASQRDVKAFNNYINNGGDINQISVYDQLAIAIAKDPDFLTKPENFESFYGLVYKPLQQQQGGNSIKKFIENLGPSIGETVNNLKDAAVNSAQTLKDEAELAYRKATGQTHDADYQTLLSRVAQEEATESQAEGKALSDTWDFVSGTANGLFQITKPLAQWVMGRDAKSRDEIDRTFAQALQQTVATQQKLHGLGDQLQKSGATSYNAVGAYSDLNKQIATAQPNQSALAGTAMALSPLNFIGFGAGEEAVGAFKPLFFGKASQATEDLAGATAKKLGLDATQILPENPELSAARPGYIETRNAQAGVAPIARQAAQDVATSRQNLADRLTSLNKISGDPGTSTWFASKVMQATGVTLSGVGELASKVTEVPKMLAGRLSGGNEVIKDALTEAFKKTVFGGFLHHFGPIGGAIETGLEHAPKVASMMGDVFDAMGQELMAGETQIPYWQRVAQKTKYVSKGMASFLDSPAIQTATAMATGGAEAAAVGGTLGGLQAKGQGQPFATGALGGALQGGILGMAGGGFGQWMKFRDPNQYLLQARGDWKRYRDMMSPAERQNFSQLSSTNQLMLAQHAQHFPDLRVSYINDPNGPQGFHYFDQANRSNIQLNLASPDSVIRGTLAHELIHGATTSGMLPEVLDTLLGNPERRQIGQYTALDAKGDPIGTDPATGRYQTNQEFANYRNAYMNQMTEMGLPTSHLNDASIAKEIFAEHGVDYMMSGGALLDANSAFRPGMFSENAMKTALAKIGYTFDGNGKMIGAPNGTISGTGLFNDLQRNPALMKLAQSYFQKGVHEGAINSEEQSTRRFTRKDMQNPNVSETWLQNDPQIIRDEKGNVIRNPLTGEPAYRSPKEVKAYNAKFADALRSGVETLPEADRMDLGYRKTGENSFFVRYLPDAVLDSLAKTNEYNPHQIASLRMLSRVLADKGDPGAEIRMFYRKATTPSKRYGSFEGTEKFAVPYGFEVSGQNNVNIKSVDFNQLGKNYQRVQSRDPYKNLWKSVGDFDQDAHTYFVNHSKGDPGATGLGEAKRDAINALAGFDTQTHRESNPLVDRMPNSVRPIIKDYSIDRANQISATGAKRPFISEEQYYKMNRNYLPGASDVSYRPRAVSEGPARAPAELRTNTPERQAEIAQTQAKAQKWLNKEDVPDMSTAAYLSGQRQFPEGKMTNEQLGNFVGANHDKLDISQPDVRDRMAHAMTYDIMDALSKNGNAQGWYDETVDRSINHVAQRLDPTILSNPENQRMFKLAVAITSQGQKVHPNFESGYLAYQHWKQTGEMPTSRDVFGGGVNAEAMEKNFAKVNQLKNKLGSDGFRDFLEQPISVRDLKKNYGIKVANESADMTLPGAAALGPKIGSFYSNLNKHFDTITMDLWLARTMHRMQGDMFGYSESAFRNQIGELKDRINNDEINLPDAQKNRILRQIDTMENVKEGALTRDRAQRGGKAILDWADTTHGLFKRPDPVTGKTYSDRSDVNYLAKNIDNNVTKISDDPGGVADRTQIRDVFSRAKQKLTDAGIHLNNADMQALIWYREQELFKKAGALSRGSENFDYLDAAHGLVNKYARNAPAAQAAR